MWRVPVFLLLVPIYTAIAWGSYIGAKWLLTLLGVSGTDQVVMAVMAVILLFAVAWAMFAATD
jgi:hypothetical protein